MCADRKGAGLAEYSDALTCIRSCRKERLPGYDGSDPQGSFPAHRRRVCRRRGSRPTGCIPFLQPADGHVAHSATTHTEWTDDAQVPLRDERQMLARKPRHSKNIPVAFVLTVILKQLRSINLEGGQQASQS